MIAFFVEFFEVVFVGFAIFLPFTGSYLKYHFLERDAVLFKELYEAQLIIRLPKYPALIE